MRLRVGGVRCGIVTCDGRAPILHTSGHVVLGRLALRGAAAPVEIGATAAGYLSIGDRTFVNQGASIVATHYIAIGDDVRIGDYVAIFDSDWHAVDEDADVRQAPVEIGDNVWLGRGVVVLPGSEIGAHSVIGANSVVSGAIPARSLASGAPARVTRSIRASDGWRRK